MFIMTHERFPALFLHSNKSSKYYFQCSLSEKRTIFQRIDLFYIKFITICKERLFSHQRIPVLEIIPGK